MVCGMWCVCGRGVACGVCGCVCGVCRCMWCESYGCVWYVVRCACLQVRCVVIMRYAVMRGSGDVCGVWCVGVVFVWYVVWYVVCCMLY